MVHALFPPQVVTVTANPEIAQGQLFDAEADCIRRMVPKRRLEFTLGRLCAREALAALGITGYPLIVGPDRLPIWPPAIVGSITHCEGYCGVAVARAADVIGVGLDAEPNAPLPPNLRHLVLTPSEMTWNEGPCPPGLAGWSRLFFSAKESAYKCYYPIGRTVLEFHDLEVSFDGTEGWFVARFQRDVTSQFLAGTLLHGRFAYNSTHLFTAVSLLPRCGSSS